MARCGCQGASCSCVVKGGGGVSVAGAGSAANPYIISSDLNLAVVDSATVDLGLSGDGSSANPFVLTAAAALNLDDLLDVDTSSGVTGYVLARQSDGLYRLVAPTTAAAGAITVGSGISGDGSSGAPLSVKLAPSSGLVVDGTGLKVAGGGAWTAFAAALTASTTNPTIGNGSIEAAYSQNGKTVNVSYEVNIGSSTKRGVGAWSLSLPVPAIATRAQVLAVQLAAVGVADFTGVAKIETVGGVSVVSRIFIATSTAAQSLSHSVPSALGAGSRLTISGAYEAA